MQENRPEANWEVITFLEISEGVQHVKVTCRVLDSLSKNDYSNLRVYTRLPIERHRKSLSRTKEGNASLRGGAKSLKITRAGQLRSRAGRWFWWERSSMDERGLYLYDGTGNPWAGHSNVIAPPRYILNVCESASDGNFGRALATGSKFGGARETVF